MIGDCSRLQANNKRDLTGKLFCILIQNINRETDTIWINSIRQAAHLKVIASGESVKPCKLCSQRLVWESYWWTASNAERKTFPILFLCDFLISFVWYFFCAIWRTIYIIHFLCFILVWLIFFLSRRTRKKRERNEWKDSYQRDSIFLIWLFHARHEIVFLFFTRISLFGCFYIAIKLYKQLWDILSFFWIKLNLSMNDQLNISSNLKRKLCSYIFSLANLVFDVVWVVSVNFN